MIEAPPIDIARIWWQQIEFFVQRALFILGQNPEARVTSWWRSEATNSRVGGSPVSQHLVGVAFDAALLGGPASQYLNAVRRTGMVGVDEGDHVHVQLFGRGIASSAITATLRHLRV